MKVLTSTFFVLVSVLSIGAIEKRAVEPVYVAPEAITLEISDGRHNTSPSIPEGSGSVLVHAEGKVYKFKTASFKNYETRLAKADKRRQEFARVIRKGKRLNTDVIINPSAQDALGFLKIDLQGAPLVDGQQLGNRIQALEARLEDLERKK